MTSAASCASSCYAACDTAYVQAARRWIYVGRDNSTTFAVVDARAGRVVGSSKTPYPTMVLGNS